jgi:hypothetical protein
MTAADLAAFHDPKAKTMWLVFRKDGTPYFTTTYNLDRERHLWSVSYIIKEVRITPTGDDVTLEVVQ